MKTNYTIKKIQLIILMPLVILLLSCEGMSILLGEDNLNIVYDLYFSEILQDGVGADGLEGATAICISPDQKFIYAAGYDEDKLSVFSRNSSTGALTEEFVYSDTFLSGIRDIIISSDGNHLYCTACLDDSLTHFTRNTATGELTLVYTYSDDIGGDDGLAYAYGISFSPDEQDIYVCGFNDDSVAQYRRNTLTGELSFYDIIVDVPLHEGAYRAVVSPDGRNVYVAGGHADCLTVYTRNTITGALTYLEDFKEGVGGVVGIDRCHDIIISANGSHVYASGRNSNSIVLFTRNGVTGALTYGTTYYDGVDEVDALLSVRKIELSPEERYIYSAAYSEGKLGVFERDPTTGLLTYNKCFENGVDGVDGLNGIRDILITSDGAHMYVSAEIDNSIVHFNRY